MTVAEERTLVRAEVSIPSSEDLTLSPGDIVAERYRIVALLGMGGVGEVYRADDLKLGQKVALKRLFPRLRTRATLDLLYREIRNGRQLSHPNLCRIYDVVETGSECFVSMEFIDGETVAALLRRIGHLPSAKGLEVAHDLASGLKAIHDRGMLHRDLKPGNILIDEEGRARITDFGLAVCGRDAVPDSFEGTMAYMAPEVLRGTPASRASDVYSLGLTLYEIFTGRRVHRGATAAEVLASHESAVVPPSRYAPDIDPVIERAILRSVEREPDRRPRDAAELLAILPPRDPRQSAIRRGHLSSSDPRIGTQGEVALSRGRAAIVAAAAIAALLALAFLSSRTGLPRSIAGGSSGAALAQHAHDLLLSCGFAEPFESESFWVTMARGESIEPLLVYRQAAGPVAAANEWGRWSLDDPRGEGIATVLLDRHGRLRSLIARPGGRQGAGSFVFATLLERAAVTPRSFADAAPAIVPPVGHDERRAWVAEDTPVGTARVEAAFVRGVPVYFDVLPIGTTTPTIDRVTHHPEPDLGFPPLFSIVLTTAGLVVATIAARHNLVRGRADLRSAARLSAALGTTVFFAWAVLANHEWSVTREWTLLMRGAGLALLHAAAAWILYVAAEPYVRSQSPHRIASFNRLLGGRVTAATVGRDLLIGIATGVAGRLILIVDEVLPLRAGAAMTGEAPGILLSLGPPSGMAFIAFYYPFIAVFFALGLAFLLLIVRRVTGGDRTALVALWILVSVLGVSGDNPAMELGLSLLRTALLLWTLHRFGVLALATSWLAYFLVLRFPLTLDPAAWFASRSFLLIAILTAATLYGYRIATGRGHFVTRLLSTPTVRRG